MTIPPAAMLTGLGAIVMALTGAVWSDTTGAIDEVKLEQRDTRLEMRLELKELRGAIVEQRVAIERLEQQLAWLRKPVAGDEGAR